VNTRVISGDGHRATQRIYFFNQMTLANTANCWVTRHLTKGFDVLSQQ
jgi:hypothetical protein